MTERFPDDIGEPPQRRCEGPRCCSATAPRRSRAMAVVRGGHNTASQLRRNTNPRDFRSVREKRLSGLGVLVRAVGNRAVWGMASRSRDRSTTPPLWSDMQTAMYRVGAGVQVVPHGIVPPGGTHVACLGAARFVSAITGDNERGAPS